VYGRRNGQAQMIPGWPYSVIAALEPGRTSWTAPLVAPAARGEHDPGPQPVPVLAARRPGTGRQHGLFPPADRTITYGLGTVI
jgi:hypothetical protein